jgi:hypothetical protein
MEQEIIDLDVLRPKSRVVRLGGKEIDVSFVPCAITWEVDNLRREIVKIDPVKAQEGGEETKKAFDATVELCTVFCSRKHPEMTRDWFLDNTDPLQINNLATLIMETLTRSYAGVEAYSKNPAAVEGTE